MTVDEILYDYSMSKYFNKLVYVKSLGSFKLYKSFETTFKLKLAYLHITFL